MTTTENQPDISTSNQTSANETPKLDPEVLQAIDDSLEILEKNLESFDEIRDYFKEVLTNTFSKIKPRVVFSKEKTPHKKSGYNLYISSRFKAEKDSNLATTDRLSQYAKEWSTLSAAEQKPYNDEADSVNKEIANVTDKITKKRPMSGYNLHNSRLTEEYKKKFPDMKSSERSAKIRSEWKAMSKEEQDKYSQEAKEIFNKKMVAT